MFETCRACLTSFNVVTGPYFQFDSKTISNLAKHKFNTVIPEMDLNIPNQIFLCDSCHTSLENAYQFKMKCFRTEEMIKKYLNSKCVINIEDFDLKAVAFECCDILENCDTNVTLDEETTDPNLSQNKQEGPSDNTGSSAVIFVEEIVESSSVDPVSTHPILREILNSNSNNLNNELEVKEEVDDITIVKHEVGNFFCNEEEVIQTRNNVMYPNNSNIHKESLLYSLLLNNNTPITFNNNFTSNNKNQSSDKPLEKINNKTVYTTVTNINPHPLSHIIQNNINNDSVYLPERTPLTQNNPLYQHQNNYIIINNTNLSQINPIFQNIQNSSNIIDGGGVLYHNIQNTDNFSRRKLPESKVQLQNIQKPKKKINEEKVASSNHRKINTVKASQPAEISLINNRNVSQINPVFHNIPNHYIYKRRKLEEGNIHEDEAYSDYLKRFNEDNCDILDQSLGNGENNLLIESAPSDEIVETPTYKNSSDIDIIDPVSGETIYPPVISISENYPISEICNFPIINDIIDAQSLDSSIDQQDSDSSTNPEKLGGVQVIPHLKKFFVCDLCGKLLSTRFYAFHMKRHK